ncbi:MAG: hypothetical protein GKR88_18515 [Flavobacteriaceae bacterium]|nr:MAG: hypothetical protein GKR88_18515 [Flavobacteriaceae bacterium]
MKTIKLDLINWLIHLKDEAIINKINSIKNNDKDSIDSFFEENNQIRRLLDQRLKERPTTFTDARVSLNKIKEQHGL